MRTEPELGWRSTRTGNLSKELFLGMDIYTSYDIRRMARFQPFPLRDAVIHYAYFTRRLKNTGISASAEELKQCLDFLEFNRTDQPRSYSDYFRHPLVMAIFGIWVLAANSVVQQTLLKA